MKRLSISSCLLVAAMLAVLIPQLAWAAEEPFKWYGIGGDLTTVSSEPRRWLGRIGMSDDLGAEILFSLQHVECDNPLIDCDYTRVDVGAGFIYDLVPSATLTPYVAGRFILSMADNGEDENSGIIETAGGIEYVISKRVGLSAELNFSIQTDPTVILTSTRTRFYFYF